MTKDEIDASGAPHSCIRSTSPLSKEVALADRFAKVPAVDDQCGNVDCKLGFVTVADRDLIVAALRAATPAAGMREALEPFISKVQWPMYGLADTDVVQCNVVTPDYETGGIKRAFFGLLVSDFKRLAEAAALRSVQPPGEARAQIIEECAKVADAETLKHSDWAQMAEHVLSDHVAACKQLASAMTAQEIAANIRALASLPPVSGDGRK